MKISELSSSLSHRLRGLKHATDRIRSRFDITSQERLILNDVVFAIGLWDERSVAWELLEVEDLGRDLDTVLESLINGAEDCVAKLEAKIDSDLVALCERLENLAHGISRLLDLYEDHDMFQSVMLRHRALSRRSRSCPNLRESHRAHVRRASLDEILLYGALGLSRQPLRGRVSVDDDTLSLASSVLEILDRRSNMNGASPEPLVRKQTRDILRKQPDAHQTRVPVLIPGSINTVGPRPKSAASDAPPTRIEASAPTDGDVGAEAGVDVVAESTSGTISSQTSSMDRPERRFRIDFSGMRQSIRSAIKLMATRELSGLAVKPYEASESVYASSFGEEGRIYFDRVEAFTIRPQFDSSSMSVTWRSCTATPMPFSWLDYGSAIEEKKIHSLMNTFYRLSADQQATINKLVTLRNIERKDKSIIWTVVGLNAVRRRPLPALLRLGGYTELQVYLGCTGNNVRSLYGANNGLFPIQTLELDSPDDTEDEEPGPSELKGIRPSKLSRNRDAGLSAAVKTRERSRPAKVETLDDVSASRKTRVSDVRLRPVEPTQPMQPEQQVRLPSQQHQAIPNPSHEQQFHALRHGQQLHQGLKPPLQHWTDRSDLAYVDPQQRREQESLAEQEHRNFLSQQASAPNVQEVQDRRRPHAPQQQYQPQQHEHQQSQTQHYQQPLEYQLLQSQQEMQRMRHELSRQSELIADRMRQGRERDRDLDHVVRRAKREHERERRRYQVQIENELDYLAYKASEQRRELRRKYRRDAEESAYDRRRLHREAATKNDELRYSEQVLKSRNRHIRRQAEELSSRQEELESLKDGREQSSQRWYDAVDHQPYTETTETTNDAAQAPFNASSTGYPGSLSSAQPHSHSTSQRRMSVGRVSDSSEHSLTVNRSASDDERPKRTAYTTRGRSRERMGLAGPASGALPTPSREANVIMIGNSPTLETAAFRPRRRSRSPKRVRHAEDLHERVPVVVERAERYEKVPEAGISRRVTFSSDDGT